MVTQNVEALKRNTPSDVLVASGSITKLSQITNIDNYKTVIVQGRDFTIDQNLWLSSVSPKALIVLGGDVIIDSNVQKIHASIFTDK